MIFGRALRTAVVLAALLVVTVLGWQWFEPAHSPAPDIEPPPAESGVIHLDPTAQSNAGLETVTVGRRKVQDRLQAPGVLGLDETRTARIGSIVEGKVLTVSADVGDRIRQGEILAELHSQIIHETWAAYRKAMAERRRANSELTYARQAHERAQRLFDDKAISLQEVQRALADRQSAQESLDMAQTELRRSQEALEHLGITSGDDPSGESGEQIPVRSPIDGAVLERNVTTGTAVTPGTPLFVVSDLTNLWALAEIDETKLSLVRVGLPVEARVAAYPGETFAGVVIFVADTLDPKTRRVTVRCRIANSDGRLKPQMFATIRLGEGSAREVIAVPTAAIQQIEGHTNVFVGEGDGTFRRRPLTIGAEVDGWVEVIDGLTPGETVVTSGSFLLKSQMLNTAPIED